MNKKYVKHNSLTRFLQNSMINMKFSRFVFNEIQYYVQPRHKDAGTTDQLCDHSRPLTVRNEAVRINIVCISLRCMVVTRLDTLPRIITSNFNKLNLTRLVGQPSNMCVNAI